ncbi:MAG: hypothetical protein KGL39_52305, partial [Patescibacteria group bacterium]|nr:hypothetical protein [Patescibacteria group bacterium]
MNTLTDAAEGRLVGYADLGPIGKRPYVETARHGVTLTAPEDAAWTPEQIKSACEHLRDYLGAQSRVTMMVAIGEGGDGLPTLMMWPDGILKGGQLHVTSTTFASLFSEAYRHVADHHAHAKARA